MILLDTCTLLWLVNGGRGLSPVARAEITAGADFLFVAAISAFEIGQKAAKGKLRLPLPAIEWYRRALAAHGLRELPLSP